MQTSKAEYTLVKQQKKKVHILNSLVDVTDYDRASDKILAWTKDDEAHYIIAANVHVIMTAYRDPAYHEVIQSASIVTPDGVPLVWVMRLRGIRNQSRVYGPDLMLAICRKAEEHCIPIYLFGSTETTLRELGEKLKLLYPALKIAGTKSPPFREQTDEEKGEDIRDINASGAGIVFVALGAPKQETWAYKNKSKLKAVIVNVGAAFEFISGQTPQAPRWMMKLGLEWFFRLCTEPRRLWKRHLFNDPAFIFLSVIQHIKFKITRDENRPVQ